MTNDSPTVDQPESFGDLFAARFQVRFDSRSAQSVEGGDELFISAPVGRAVGGHQQIMGRQMKCPLGFLTVIQFGNQLADAVNQYVFVMDGR